MLQFVPALLWPHTKLIVPFKDYYFSADFVARKLTLHVLIYMYIVN